MPKIPITAAVCVSLILGVSDSHAQNTDWQASLQPLQSGERGARDPFRIQLPADTKSETLQYLALELDGIDHSSIVTLDDTHGQLTLVLKPAKSLAPGQHELRLVEYTAAGDIAERGVFNVTVTQTVTTVNKWRIATRTQADFIRRVADGDLPDLPGATQGQGSANIQTKFSRGNLDVQAVADFLYDSQGVQLADGGAGDDPRGGRDFDIGEFLIQGKAQRVSALLGHHAVGHQSLLMQSFHRRGLSVNAATENQMLSASGFAFRTEPITGFEHGFGFSNPEHRVAGALATLRPIPGQLNSLAITTSYLRGEGQDQFGVGIGGDELRSEGDGWSIVAESRLQKDRLKLRAELAETDHDFDGSGPVFDRAKDQAHSLLAQYSVLDNKIYRKQPMQWDLGVEYQNVGLRFRSLANPTLPSDKEYVRGYSNFSWSGWALQVQVAQEQDNVDDDPLLPQLENDLASFSINYMPRVATDAQGQPVSRWFGQPNFLFATQYAHQEHARLPQGFSANRIDQRITYNQLNASFQYPSWHWSAGYGWGEEEDLTANTGDRRNRLVDLSGNWRFGKRVGIGAQMQYNTILDRRSAVETRTAVAGLNGNFVLIPEKLNANVRISLSDNSASDNSIDSETLTYGLNFVWQLIKPRANRPGFALWLRGERQEIDNRLMPQNNTDPYQVFFGARVDWSLDFARGYR